MKEGPAMPGQVVAVTISPSFPKVNCGHLLGDHTPLWVENPR